MEKVRGVDYYGIETLLSEDERRMRDAVRDWVEAEFVPIVAEHHRAGTFPVALIPKLGELGVFGATLKGYGCAGLSIRADHWRTRFRQGNRRAHHSQTIPPRGRSVRCHQLFGDS